MKAFIYARISLDKEGEGLGVERQLEDCRQLVGTKGWELAGEYVDNDVSAFSGKKRPAFLKMLAELRPGDAVVVWRTDRLARRGKDLQLFIDTGAELHSCTEPEFTGATGMLMLRILNGFAEHESAVKSERVKRKYRQKAENGHPHAGGKRMFGYTADGKQPVPAEADLVRDAARRILSGETISGVLRDWTKKGVPTVEGGRWNPSNFSRTLRSPLYAGYRLVGGELVQGTWPAILDLDTWKRLSVVLEGRGRRTSKPGSHLLAGLLKCGRCGANLGGGPSHYRCKSELFGGCGRIGIQRERVEAYVVRQVFDAIPHESQPSAENEVEGLLHQLRETEADVAQLSKDHYVEKRISRAAYLAANDELEARCEWLRSQIAGSQPTASNLDELEQRWEHESQSWRQAVLRSVLVEVVVLPAGGTRRPVEERLELRWRA